MYFIFILLFLITSLAHAQVDVQWSRTFGYPNQYEGAFSVAQGNDGGYFLGGYPGWVIKTDDQGLADWARTFSGEDVYSILQDSDGGCVVACNADSALRLHKLDAQGDSVWNRNFPQIRAVNHSSPILARHDDGGYTLIGPNRTLSNRITVARTDSVGVLIWQRTYAVSISLGMASVALSNDGGCVVAFGVWQHTTEDIWLLRLDANGDSLWCRSYGGPNADQPWSITRCADGGFAIAGQTTSFGHGNYDFWVIKVNSNGDSLWSRALGGIYYDAGRSIAETEDHGFVIAGNTTSFGPRVPEWLNVWIAKTDSLGNVEWTEAFGGDSSDDCNSVRQTSDGGYVFAGSTRSFGAGLTDFWLLKTTPELSVEDPVILSPSSFVLSNYPNPFNASTTITFDLPRESHVLLNVFDLTGRSVATLKDGMMLSGSHHLNFNAAALPSGIYVDRLTSGNISQSRKLVLLK